jgi:hypothetical protein
LEPKRFDYALLGEEILTPFPLGAPIIVELHPRHGGAVAVETAVLAADVRVDHPVAEPLFPKS